MRDELAVSRLWMKGGLLVVALGLALVAVPPAVSRLGHAVSASRSASMDTERHYLPLEWNGNRQPVRFEHMFMSAERRPGSLEREADGH